MKTYPKAKLGNRLGSYFIDYIISGLPGLIIGCPLFIILINAKPGDAMSPFAVILFICLILAALFQMAYFLLRDGIPKGSIGRRTVGQLLIDLNTGKQVSYGKSALRNLLFSFLGLIDILVLLLDKNGRSVSDMIVGTQVVDKDNV